ncbi:MAG: isopeptide-forming domain-containing fimbrial protein [Candidatus Choladocola sp.]|nr:isopeptide-forming domain-containing fimbrial protein [Candidatus Choladocola sp.]
MKRMKKFVSLLLAAVMVLAMATTVFAEESGNYTITINNAATDHTYEAYQIFTGDLSGKTLSNIVWGSGITSEGQDYLQNKYDTAGTKSAAGVAAALTDITAVQFAKEAAVYLSETKALSIYDDANKKYIISNLTAGYYLVKDQNGSLTYADDAYTSYILQVVKDTEVSPKSAKPTVDKQVHDETADAEAGATDGWGESADHAINESFQFKLIANLPTDTNFNDYETYKVIFTDTMSKGVTFESIASVTVDGVTLQADQYSATATAGQAGGNWTLTITDIKSISGVNLTDGAQIVVIYNAHLNEAAQVNHKSGTTTNQNKVYLQYSNNPNAGGEGELGKTPEDIVWVFTYEVDNTKVDATNSENKTPLAGAGFRLYDSEGTTEIELIYDETLSAYRPVKGGETAEEMTSADKTGVFNIIGLDAGTYILKETTVPAGYNKCADITVVISATHTEDKGGESANTILSEESNVTNTIENRQGSTLPETGGIGTTIFYVLGSILVIGAAILLITRKRMHTEK